MFARVETGEQNCMDGHQKMQCLYGVPNIMHYADARSVVQHDITNGTSVSGICLPCSLIKITPARDPN